MKHSKIDLHPTLLCTRCTSSTQHVGCCVEGGRHTPLLLPLHLPSLPVLCTHSNQAHAHLNRPPGCLVSSVETL